jgi:ribosome-associated toxin RatA of RatAB toxin-antitoxin module
MRTNASRRRFLLAASTLGGAQLLAPSASAWSQSVTGAPAVTVECQGSDILVEAHAEVPAGVDATWLTLADYDHFAEFIPDLTSSRTLSREGARAVVGQEAVASFGPFRQKLALVLAVEEERFRSIRAAVVEGDFRRFDARYDVVPLGARRTRVDYHAVLEPTVAMPPFFGVAIMRGQMQRQFQALLGEIGRRAGTV